MKDKAGLERRDKLFSRSFFMKMRRGELAACSLCLQQHPLPQAVKKSYPTRAAISHARVGSAMTSARR